MCHELSFGEFSKEVVMVFLDDILIYSPNLETRIHHIKLVLAKLREHQFYLKLKKCSFVKHELKYLGPVISREGWQQIPVKLQSRCLGHNPEMLRNSGDFWV